MDGITQRTPRPDGVFPRRTVAHVATDAAIGRTFDYAIPPELAASVGPGSLVRVEFGRRQIDALVLDVSDRSAHPGALKPVLGAAAGKPWLSAALIKLARWMSSYYLAPIELCLKIMLPPVVRDGTREDGFKRRLVVRRARGSAAAKPATARQREILERLGDGEENVAGFCKAWGVSPPTLRKMAAAGLAEIFEKVERRDPLAGRRVLPSRPLPLTGEQAAALALVRAACDAPADGPPPRPVLIRGVTASGKTEVYLQAIAGELAAGRGAIVLVPEIALTPQTIQRFAARFGNTVAVLHSQLGAGERHDEWARIRSGEARVVVGPRSALFAPVERLGLIVVDEEHEPSYKQDETPRYNARDTAVVRARFEHCAVVLGSATPSLESWRNAQDGKYALATMTRRAVGEAQLPRTVVVDMRGEAAKAEGKLPVFSETLVQAVRRRLELGEQTMLFLNRRGYAPTVTCPSCGHREECSECSVPMTWHRDDGVLRCHVCGAFRSPPRRCPACGCPDYRYGGVGTQRVEAVARRLFPGASVERMDLDVTTRKSSHEEILDRFRAGKTDILVGTQMIAKGLDFPNVTLAGILNADAGLAVPDFRAAERTFQLVAQMAGRTGRGLRPGDVIVQTLSPDEPAIRLAAREDYEAFARGELAERLELCYPPFAHLHCATFRSGNREAAAAAAARFAAAVGRSERYLLGDAAPAAVEKAKGLWRFQVVLRGPDPAALLERLRAALAATAAAAERDRVSVSVDVDAVGAF
ncbi:MAG: primosomal protein N' [Kiritimatiellae bacterium]|nr:primosomal protein N' [Kiritimatiellia bacterium]